MEQVLAEAAVALPPRARRDDVRATYAGLRVLPAGTGEASARRETVFTIGPGGMLSVAGGKLTTYRRIALDALERFADRSGSGRRSTPLALPGARGVAPAPGRPRAGRRGHLRHLYGSRAAEVVAAAADDPSLLDRLHPTGPTSRRRPVTP